MTPSQWSSLWLVPMVVITVPAYASQYLTVAEAQRVLFPDANAFIDKRLTLTDQQRSEIKSLSGLRQRNREQSVWRAEEDGAPLGWFIVDDVIGKHEFITYGVALSLDGHVLGVEIMVYRESHGDEVRGADWRQNLTGKTLSDRFKLNVDVPNISGATLSCRNVMDGVKRLLALQQVALTDG